MRTPRPSPIFKSRVQILNRDWRFGHVALVRYLHVEQAMQQWRPALVVRSFETPVATLLWVLMITSADHRGWHGDVDIEALEIAGLRLPSIVRTAKIATIDAHAVQCIGTLAEEDRTKVAAAIDFKIS